ncbi:MAG: type III-A CRISPR-associated RAMP protein Csm5, partial [Syntrophales bacterium]|nr:type III-A CRISPR-associated RAMP protein Csm5 [Syntrophales bacterium]
MTVTKHFFIKILTPVHIGCDEVYDPLSFVVDEGRKKIVVFDPLDFFGHLSEKDRNQLNEICRKGTVSSLLELMKFMRGKKAVGWEVDVCRGFISHYANSLSMGLGDERRIQQELNRFEIKRTAYNPYTLRPYLPGSSIKGSLRTAYLNLIAKKKPHVKSNPKEKKANIRLEQELLDYNDIESDPFRMLKVSDFLPVKATTRIVYAVNEKKTGQEGARGLSQILEIVEPGSWFVGTISVTEQKERHPKIRHQLTMENLLLGVKNFYEKEKGREERELQLAKINPCHLDVDGGCLLRLGHHSGAESVTIEGHRSILIRGKKKY